MLEDFIYENHLGKRFYGKENGVYLANSNLRDYRWQYDTINSRISRFYRPVKSRSFQLLIASPYEVEAVRVKNLLCELAESDIAANVPGKIYIGDYYTLGYITESSKRDYLVSDRHCKLDLVLTSDDPAWYREETYSFTPGQSVTAGTGIGTDHPYDYAYDYAPSAPGSIINCDSVTPNKFILTVYGPAIAPTVVIGGHAYRVFGNVSAGNTLVIDSAKKTITLISASGSTTNWFDRRYRGSYIFEPIPPGKSSVISNGDFAYDLTVVMERSEPKWT